MKNILLIITLLFTVPAYADVYVITSPTGEIHSLSERQDAVIPPGYSEDIIKNKTIADLALDQDVTDYKYNGKKFSIDTKRVSDKRKKEAELQAEIEDRKSARKSGIEKLKTLGLTDAEISAIVGR